QNQVIIVRGGKIAAVGPAVSIPPGIPVVDLSQEWVLPGLMDAHTHITMGVPPAPGPVTAWEGYLLHESTATRALRGLHNRKAVRQNTYYGAKMIKLASDAQSYHFSLDEIRAAADETHKAGLTLAVHTLGGEAARNAILGGADSVEHGYELTDELLQLMKEK